jgi:hypothetical protein
MDCLGPGAAGVHLSAGVALELNSAGTLVGRKIKRHDVHVGASGSALVAVHHLINGILFEVRQYVVGITEIHAGCRAAGVEAASSGQMLVRIVVAVQRQADLLHVILALRAGGGVTHLLHGWH